MVANLHSHSLRNEEPPGFIQDSLAAHSVKEGDEAHTLCPGGEMEA